jgi:hypothetical protein
MTYGPETVTDEALILNLKRMTPEQWAAAGGAWGAWGATRAAARAAATAASWAASWAANETQGAAFMRNRGQPFYFLPMFGFADPEAVLAADNEHEQ